MSKRQIQNSVLRDKNLIGDLVPVFLPKELVATLVKNYVSKNLQKSLSSMSKKEIMNKLHKTRREILVHKSSDYINYNS